MYLYNYYNLKRPRQWTMTPWKMNFPLNIRLADFQLQISEYHGISILLCFLKSSYFSTHFSTSSNSWWLGVHPHFWGISTHGDFRRNISTWTSGKIAWMSLKSRWHISSSSPARYWNNHGDLGCPFLGTPELLGCKVVVHLRFHLFYMISYDIIWYAMICYDICIRYLKTNTSYIYPHAFVYGKTIWWGQPVWSWPGQLISAKRMVIDLQNWWLGLADCFYMFLPSGKLA